MTNRFKRSVIAGLVAAAGLCLSGCYTSGGSIIAAADSGQYLRTGSYCEYSYDKDKQTWGACQAVVIAAGGNRNYTYTTSTSTGAYSINIASAPLQYGEFQGSYVAQACWTDKGEKNCYIGIVTFYQDNSMRWVLPTCTSPSSGTDPCKINDLEQAREAFATASVTGVEDLRKYVAQ